MNLQTKVINLQRSRTVFKIVSNSLWSSFTKVLMNTNKSYRACIMMLIPLLVERRGSINPVKIVMCTLCSIAGLLALHTYYNREISHCRPATERVVVNTLARSGFAPAWIVL